MRALLAVMVVAVIGCASGPPPSHIVVVPDLVFQGNTDQMSKLKTAAGWWSEVGANVEIRLSGDGVQMHSVPSSLWNHKPVAYAIHGEDLGDPACPTGQCIQFQREVFDSLSPGEQEVGFAHEIGHALGLWDTFNDPWAMMNQKIHPVADPPGLRPDDIAEYRSIHP